MGETPTAAGVTRIVLPGATSFFWESVKGHICLGEFELSGQMQAIKCGKGKVKPKGTSKLAALFGPGMLGSKARVVLVAEPGLQVVSVDYRKQRMDWTFIRTLSPSGRGVYYVTLPDWPEDWLNVTLISGQQQNVDRIWLGW
ncbi:hypothetical protein [Streptomyces sp. NPDC006527]|uniref:hypothetical protein n=1 Tax=Streptomyces sp. NPDC006527 TaxID=3364749 RepID=UPI0036BB7961